jgi:hypothetical protein
MTTELILSPASQMQPALFTPTPKAARRVLEFLTAQVNNDNTRKAYLNATRRFAEWCDQKGIRQLADVQAFHVAAFLKDLQGDFSAPTVKQHLAGLRMLFDWLVTGHVLETNPAHASARSPDCASATCGISANSGRSSESLFIILSLARNPSIEAPDKHGCLQSCFPFSKRDIRSVTWGEALRFSRPYIS